MAAGHMTETTSGVEGPVKGAWTPTKHLLEVHALRTEFRTPRGVVRAVNGVSFAVAEGELLGLVGETGCGKSVTARSILGLIRPPGHVVGGRITFDAVDLQNLKRRDLQKLRGSEISFVPQNPWGSLNPILSIEQQFRNVIKAHRPDLAKQRCSDMALEMLQAVGIHDAMRVLKGHAHELSGGMAQRVVIAIAMVLDPRLVIADEPTTGLDVTIQRQILDLVRRLLREHSRSMILVTHDLGVVAQYCDRVAVMYAGKIVEIGPVHEVMKEPAHPYTHALLQAIPRPGRRLVPLLGTVPSLINYPAGCPFHPRCAFVQENSRQIEPELRELTPGRAVACHLPEGVSAHVAASNR